MEIHVFPYPAPSHLMRSPLRLSCHGQARINTATDKTIALSVRFNPSESSAHPCMTNCANVVVAQGIAYVDFGFIEPTMLAKVMVDSQNGQALPEQVEGKLVVRVSLGLDVLARLQHQMQQVFLSMRQAQVMG